MGQRAGQLEILSRDVMMDGRSKSSLMSSLIEMADAQRRCVIAGTNGASGPRTIQARYGFRCCVDQFGSSPQPR